MGQSIQEWKVKLCKIKQNLWKTAFEKTGGIWSASADCLPQILLGPFLNTFSHLGVKLKSSIKDVVLFHDGGPYHIETGPLVCSAIQWTDYTIGPPVMKELNMLLIINTDVELIRLLFLKVD